MKMRAAAPTCSRAADRPFVGTMSAAVLERPILVLNRNWQAINIATVARALILVWNEAARFVDPADYRLYDWDDWSRLRPDPADEVIRTGHTAFRVPEVVTLLRYDRVPQATVTFSRRNIFKRDKFVCQYCGRQPAADELTLDHIVPRSQGGQSTWENCVLACVECNHRKADRTPAQAGLTLRKEPLRPKWRPLYGGTKVPVESWTKFISEAYWNAELKP